MAERIKIALDEDVKIYLFEKSKGNGRRQHNEQKEVKKNRE